MTGAQPLPVRSRWFAAERVGETTVLTFTQADLGDEQAVQAVGSRMLDLVPDHGHPRFVLDFGRVRRVSSGLLGKLITLNRKVRQAGGELVLCALSPEVYGQFERTRLDKVFRIGPGEPPACRPPANEGAGPAG